MTTTSDPTSSPGDERATLQARLQAALALHQQGRLAEARERYQAILREQPRQANALHLLGMLQLQAGDAAGAVELIGRALAVAPGHADLHLNQAAALQQLGRLDDALAAHDRALALKPGHANAHLGRAALLRALGRRDAAIAACEQALALQPGVAEFHFNLGNLLREAGRLEEAVARYERALALQPALLAAQLNLGATQLQRGCPEAAQACLAQAVAQAPGHAGAHANLALAELGLGRAEAALAGFERALALDANLVEAHLGRGSALLALQRPADAIASFDRALALRPGHAEALRGRGIAHYRDAQDAAAVQSLEAALARAPDDAETWLYLGSAQGRQHRSDAALAALDRAIALAPGNYRAWSQKGMLLAQARRFEAALACREEALRLAPDNAFLLGELMSARLYLCDWTDFDTNLARLTAAIERGELALMPFAAQPLLDAPALLRRVAVAALPTLRLPASLPGEFPARAPEEKIRVGYFSADFREHPVAQLTARLFETHDRAAVEVIGFAFGPPAQDAMRARLEKAFDRLVDISRLSDAEAAQQARELGIDIAVDLGGYTQGARPGIFACRAAPVQASYIGFLGTMGVPWMDYLIADRVLVPPALREHYVEKIVTLPWYQANEQRPAPARVFSRAELGLPAQGVVLACFNNHFKFTPPVFARWLNILRQVEDSVLYLLVDGDAARNRLRAAAEAQGIDGARIVFAERVPREDYLARYRVADLFLDTWPCNAGTTAGDALAMDVPVLTCQGQAFGARMAASVLTALGLPELITHSPDEYEQRAVALARDPAALAALRERVARQRGNAPLYDSAGFTRHLEAAFRAMHARRCAGLPPADIDIAP